MTIKRKINFNLNTVYNYIIAIPSYNRYQIINTHTIATLERHKIETKKIYIFVANKTEYQKYKNTLDSKYHKNIIIGKKGLKQQRNFISSYFPEYQCIVQFDDDIEELYELYHPIKEDYDKWINLEPQEFKKKEFRKQQTLKPIKNLNKLIQDTFKTCIIKGIYLWGIYPTPNPYFMSFNEDTRLNFIVGPMFGIINRHDRDLKLSLDEKENSERTLQYFIKDGIVLRLNNISIGTKYYKNPGGMQSEKKNRKIEAAKSVDILHSRYPTLTKKYIKKSSGMPEIKLIK